MINGIRENIIAVCSAVLNKGMMVELATNV